MKEKTWLEWRRFKNEWFPLNSDVSWDDKRAWEIVELLRPYSDGHFTLMAFTTEWKAVFDTPDLTFGEGLAQVSHLVGKPSAREAIKSAAYNFVSACSERDFYVQRERGKAQKQVDLK